MMGMPTPLRVLPPNSGLRAIIAAHPQAPTPPVLPAMPPAPQSVTLAAFKGMF